MEELFKEVFNSLPHVEHIWVMPNGDYYLHMKHGAEKVTKGNSDVSVAEVIKKKPTKKK